MKQFILIIVLLCAVSCSKFQRASLDKASQNKAVSITRLDEMQKDFIVNGSSVAMQEMAINYPEETKILIESVLRIGSVNEIDIENKFRKYFTDSPERFQLVKDVSVKHHNLGQLAKDLKKAFTKLQKEMPSLHAPRFYTQISGFNQSIVVGDSILGISLDKYMGNDYAPYKDIFYKKQIEQMKPSRIVEDCLYYWIESKMTITNYKEANLLDFMLYIGKVNWVVYNILEDESLEESKDYYLKSDNDIQEEWKNMSERLLRKEILSSTDKNTIREIMFGTHNKHNPDMMGLQAVGVPAGIKIIQDYMLRHKDLTYQQMFANERSEEILREAGYSISQN